MSRHPNEVKMKSDRWNLIEEIFQGALERPSDARMQYVEQVCGRRRGAALVKSALCSKVTAMRKLCFALP